MPPSLALLLTLGFICFLYWRDLREASDVSHALWIPLVWFLITGSKFVSQWLTLLGIPVGSSSLEDGSPLDRLIFFSLILAGVYVLYQRRVTFAEFARSNVWLTAFLAYCFLAILWSDFQFVAFKRWIKVLGHPIMALVVLTDPDPIEALRRLFKRAAFFLVPMSILFIKYFPEYGRGFDAWTGEAYNRGLFFFWNILNAFRIEDRRGRRNELLLNGAFLTMVWWLLTKSSSATSLCALMIGMSTIIILSMPFINQRYLGTYIVTGVLIFVAAEMTFGVYAKVVGMLGRNLTLTDRTDVWQLALGLQPNPLLGAGFESFWLGERLEEMWSVYWWKPNQAHSGYIETYLNLGYIGVGFLAALIVATFQKIRLDLHYRPDFARFRLGFLFAVVFYNYTEATFKGVHLVWTVFYLIAIDYPRVISGLGVSSSETDYSQKEEFAVADALEIEAETVPAPPKTALPERHFTQPGFRFQIPSRPTTRPRDKTLQTGHRL
jgi:exopolysaccharide production protein ExoQ